MKMLNKYLIKLLSISCFFIAIAGLQGQAHARDSLAAPAAFIEEISKELLQIVTGRSALASARFDNFLSKYFAIKAIANFTLGTSQGLYKKSPNIKSYHRAFKAYIVENYRNRFAAYKGQKFQVIPRTIKKGRSTWVRMKVIGDGSRAEVLWKLQLGKNGYKVLDIKINNISMALIHRKEFASTLSKPDGLKKLIVYLKQK